MEDAMFSERSICSSVDYHTYSMVYALQKPVSFHGPECLLSGRSIEEEIEVNELKTLHYESLLVCRLESAVVVPIQELTSRGMERP